MLVNINILKLIYYKIAKMFNNWKLKREIVTFLDTGYSHSAKKTISEQPFSAKYIQESIPSSVSIDTINHLLDELVKHGFKKKQISFISEGDGKKFYLKK